VLSADDRTNFQTLSRAFQRNHVVLLEVERVADGAVVSALCAVGHEDGLFTFTPFATMIEGNPFELFNPPNPDGGFFAEDRAG